MRFRTILSWLPLATVLAGWIPAGTAFAGSYHQDRIYADSFGNLVVHSRNGYKRIIVGGGHLAKQLSDYEATGDDGAAYLDDAEGTADLDLDGTGDECWRPAVLLKGRGYMYGLEDGELPEFPGRCVD